MFNSSFTQFLMFLIRSIFQHLLTFRVHISLFSEVGCCGQKTMGGQARLGADQMGSQDWKSQVTWFLFSRTESKHQRTHTLTTKEMHRHRHAHRHTYTYTHTHTLEHSHTSETTKLNTSQILQLVGEAYHTDTSTTQIRTLIRRDCGRHTADIHRPIAARQPLKTEPTHGVGTLT